MSTKKEKISLKKIQDELVGTSEDIWLAGLGVFSTVEAEGVKMFEKFVEKGKDMVEKGKKMEAKTKKEAKAKVTAGGSKIDEAVKYVEDKVKNIGSTVIEPLGLSSKEEVQELNEKIDKLTEIVIVLAQKVDDLNKAAKTAAKASN